ncbi:MAG TPA: L,D-transpeptidase [Gemmatimonadaceae bacterium]|nr:L,D-transpeptidase [Gemmatimonadaceae bacterium]
MRLAWIHALAGLMGLFQTRVVINIPAYRLDVLVGDSLVRSLPVAVGMPGFRTPRGEFAISSVEWNPWWVPPDRPWADRDRPMPPGATNPMGRVKLNFRPLYFLHGTPLAGSIGSAASHGCIRLANHDAIALARIVHGYGSPGLSAEDVEQLAADTVTTRLVNLERHVPLELRYDLVEIREGRVAVYRDIYGLASRPLRDAVYSALATHGIDTALVDQGRIRDLVRQVPPAGRVVPIDSLMRVGPVPLGHE